jgi:hypothetical protein
MPVPSSKFLPCRECGASVDQTAPQAHECDPERRALFMMVGLRDEIAAFETRLEAWLASSQGRFETWMAVRRVRQPHEPPPSA